MSELRMRTVEMSKKTSTGAARVVEPATRKYTSQSDVPSRSLEQAIRLPQALADNYALKPTRPANVATALGLTENSSNFRALCGAAIAYGLTDGGCNAERIAITPTGK